MEHTQVTAPAVAALDSCALGTAFGDMGAIAAQPAFRPITRRALMAAVNTVSRDLGLRAASVVVVDALLSCLPCRDAKTGAEAPITPLTLLTVFASNETLCFRAKGITDRQLRRHLDRLEQIGLIRRRDSANGKRFPIQRGGKIVGAFGLDLSPLLAQSGDLLALAERRREEAMELRGLKARIQRLRAECERLDLGQEAQAYLEGLRNLMRRASTTLVEARQVVERLLGYLDATPAVSGAAANQTSDAEPVQNSSRTGQETGSDGQNVRHKEPHQSDTINKWGQLLELWEHLETLPQYFPDAPRTDRDLLRVVYEFGKMLGLEASHLADAVKRAGVHATLWAQDRIAANAAEIVSPNHYLASLLSGGRAELAMANYRSREVLGTSE